MTSKISSGFGAEKKRVITDLQSENTERGVLREFFFDDEVVDGLSLNFTVRGSRSSLLLLLDTGAAWDLIKESVLSEDILLDVDKTVSISGVYGEERAAGFL